MVFAILAMFAWQAEECYPGQEKVAGLLNIKPRQLRRLIRELERKGLVEVHRRGVQQTNVYRLTCP